MKFVQIIEFKTKKIEEVQALDQQYLKETEGKRTSGRSWVCADRDKPDTYLVIIEFPSYEAAMKNNELPETQKIAEAQMKLADGPATFRNLDVIEEQVG